MDPRSQGQTESVVGGISEGLGLVQLLVLGWPRHWPEDSPGPAMRNGDEEP